MKINLDFYKEKQEDLLPIEEEIIKYINEKEPKDYHAIIEKDNRIEIVQALSGMAENILNWYEFNNNDTVLQIGGNFGEITGLLCEKASKVVVLEKSYKKAQAISKRYNEKENLEVIVGELEEIEINEKFDKVVISGSFEYAPLFIDGENCFEELIKYSIDKLKTDGKLLLATDNKFGIKYWAGAKDLFQTNEYKSLSQKSGKRECQLFGERQLRELLQGLNLKYNFYYVFPTYKMPNLIYDEEYKISKEDISRNFMCYSNNQTINFYENQVLDRIVKEDKKIFNFFANSFFVEISKQEIENNTRYVAFSNYRKEKYKIITIIKKDEVIKKAPNKVSQEHIKEIIDNLQYLKKYKVEVIEKGIDGEVLSEYIKGYERLDLELQKASNIEELKVLFKKYIDMLYESSINYNEININETSKEIRNYDKEKLEKMKFLEYGFIDLIPKNCFDVDGKIVVFDQEWMRKYIPVEYVIYRAIKNSNLIEKFSEEVYEAYNSLQYKDLFEKLEEEFSNEVVDYNILYNVFNRKVTTNAEVIETLEHYKNLNAIAESEKVKLQNEINELQNTLNGILDSRSWKMAEKIRKVANLGRKKEK